MQSVENCASDRRETVDGREPIAMVAARYALDSCAWPAEKGCEGCVRPVPNKG
jgi:hypothetical protein